MQAVSSRAAGSAVASISKTGAQIVVDALLEHGVDTVFGYIGASVLPLFDRLRPQRDGGAATARKCDVDVGANRSNNSNRTYAGTGPWPATINENEAAQM